MQFANLPGSPFITAVTGADTGIMLYQWATMQAGYDRYNQLLSTYNSQLAAYNTAVTTENKRATDFFRSIFEQQVKIPQRPCPPSQPPAWVGGKIDWWVPGMSINLMNETAIKGGYGILMQAISLTPSLLSGFQTATPDTTVATPVPAPGHVFGVFGQGDFTNPKDGVAFAYR